MWKGKMLIVIRQGLILYVLLGHVLLECDGQCGEAGEKWCAVGSVGIDVERRKMERLLAIGRSA